MKPVEAEDSTTLVLKRTFEGPPERVWEAWTEPELLKKWYAPVDGWIVSRCDVDARVGGSYHFEFGPPGQDPIVEKATYLEFDPPRRLVTSMQLMGARTAEQTVTTVEFKDMGGRTEVVVTEAGYSSVEAKQMHERGWTRMLEKLAGIVNACTADEP